MARLTFGSNLASWVFALQDASSQYGAGVNVVKIAPSTVVTFWPEPFGGTQYTDLLDLDNLPMVQVTTDANGSIPLFYGPEDVTLMWADAGGPRLLIEGNGISGPPGPAGVVGPPGPGEPVIYYNRTTSTWPARPSVAGVHVWAGPVFPAVGGTGGVAGDIFRLEPN